jgi:hypothetical protein
MIDIEVGDLAVRAYPSEKDDLIGLVVYLDLCGFDEGPVYNVFWCDNTYSFELPEELETPY